MGGDLHCHTKLSDGSLGIEDLISLAKRSNVSTIAIADLDCLAATVRGKIIGDRLGVQVIPGVELSASDKATGARVHILGYLNEYPDRLEGLCHRNSLVRKKAAHFMMLQVAKLYPVSTEFIVKCATGSTNIFPSHIMQALVECGCADSLYGELYQKLFSPGAPGSVYTAPKFPDAAEVVDAVHAAGGIAVLASPAADDSLAVLPRLLEHGLDGLEVWHPSADAETTEALKKLAAKHKLLCVGGTGFRGLYSPARVRVGEVETPDDALQKLLGYKARQKRLAKKAAKAAAQSAG